jgi:hypothetical protein
MDLPNLKLLTTFFVTSCILLTWSPSSDAKNNHASLDFNSEILILPKVIAAISQESFVKTDQGTGFGFNQTQTCVYAGENSIVLHNYCTSPEAPAVSFQILNPELGVVKFYLERQTSGVEFRAFRIEIFGNQLRSIWPTDKTVRQLKLNDIIKMQSKAYYSRWPGCWIHVFQNGTTPDNVGCFKEDVSKHSGWFDASAAHVKSTEKWIAAFSKIEKLISQPVHNSEPE